MTETERQAIWALRQRGWAVILFTPEELQAADPTRFEERLADMGVELADAMQPDEDWIS